MKQLSISSFAHTALLHYHHCVLTSCINWNIIIEVPTLCKPRNGTGKPPYSNITAAGSEAVWNARAADDAGVAALADAGWVPSRPPAPAAPSRSTACNEVIRPSQFMTPRTKLHPALLQRRPSSCLAPFRSICHGMCRLDRLLPQGLVVCQGIESPSGQTCEARALLQHGGQRHSHPTAKGLTRVFSPRASRWGSAAGLEMTTR